jgi:hypothetical protein
MSHLLTAFGITSKYAKRKIKMSWHWLKSLNPKNQKKSNNRWNWVLQKISSKCKVKGMTVETWPKKLEEIRALYQP